MNKVSDTWERKERREVVLKLQTSLCQAYFTPSIWKLKDQICCQYKSITTPTTCINTTGRYVHFLYEQAILWIEIYTQCFPAIQEKHSTSPAVATEVDLTCVVQVCFIVLRWWRAGLPSTTLGQHQTYASQSWFFLLTFLDHLFHFPCVSFSPPI